MWTEIGNRRDSAKEARSVFQAIQAMTQFQPDMEILRSAARGDEQAFERLYIVYEARLRLAAWRVSHRSDWIDDLANETWCRAYSHRTTYNPDRPFLVWMAGILKNVYREFCRKSRGIAGGENPDLNAGAPGIEEPGPEELAEEAEGLARLNECVEALSPEEARIVRLRFFQGLTLRLISQEVSIPESTLRDVRLPAVLGRLRRCLEKKNVDFFRIFPAQEPDEMQ